MNYRLEKFKENFSGFTPEGRKVFEQCAPEIYFHGGIDKEKKDSFVLLCNQYAKYKTLAHTTNTELLESRQDILKIMASVGQRLGLSVSEEGITPNFNGRGADFNPMKPNFNSAIIRQF